MPSRFTLTAVPTPWERLSAGPGFLLDVPYEGRWRQRPSLHFEGEEERLRLQSGGQHLMWMRFHPRWYWCGFLRGPEQSSFPWRLPHLRAAEARGIRHEPQTQEWWAAWIRRMAHQLEEAEASVLHAGRWCLFPLKAVPSTEAGRNAPLWAGLYSIPEPPHGLENALRFEPFWMEGWGWAEPSESRPEARRGGVVPLRAPSRQDDSRVKAWRKHVGDGTLPPVLMLYARLVDKWLILDGHDRLHAALLEGRLPPLLGLWLTPGGGEGDRLNAVTRAWPTTGASWRASVLEWCPRAPRGATAENWRWFVDPERFPPPL